MNTICENGFMILINLFSTYLIKVYLDIFFENKENFMSVIIWGIAYSWQICATIIEIENVWVNISFSIIYILLISIFLYLGSVYKKILFVLIFNTMWMIAEVITNTVLLQIDFGNTDTYILGACVSKLIMLLVLSIIKYKIKEEVFGEISLLHFSILLLIPIGSTYVIGYIFFCSVENIFMYQRMAYIIVLIINIMIFELYDKISAEYEMKRNSMLFEAQIELCRQNAQIQGQIVENTKQLRHDLKYLWIVMKEMVKDQKYHELDEFLNKQFELEGLEGYSNTNNIVVDSLFNYLYAKSKKDKFFLETNAMISNELAVDDGDMSLLLGNIVDNALEAIEKIQHENRFIKIQIQETKGTLLIIEQNPYSDEIKRGIRNEILSSKKEIFYHGIGISTIEKIVNKYRGTYIINTENNMFTIKILLYL